MKSFNRRKNLVTKLRNREYHHCDFNIERRCRYPLKLTNLLATNRLALNHVFLGMSYDARYVISYEPSVEEIHIWNLSPSKLLKFCSIVLDSVPADERTLTNVHMDFASRLLLILTYGLPDYNKTWRDLGMFASPCSLHLNLLSGPVRLELKVNLCFNVSFAHGASFNNIHNKLVSMAHLLPLKSGVLLNTGLSLIKLSLVDAADANTPHSEHVRQRLHPLPTNEDIHKWVERSCESLHSLKLRLNGSIIDENHYCLAEIVFDIESLLSQSAENMIKRLGGEYRGLCDYSIDVIGLAQNERTVEIVVPVVLDVTNRDSCTPIYLLAVLQIGWNMDTIQVDNMHFWENMRQLPLEQGTFTKNWYPFYDDQKIIRKLLQSTRKESILTTLPLLTCSSLPHLISGNGNVVIYK